MLVPLSLIFLYVLSFLGCIVPVTDVLHNALLLIQYSSFRHCYGTWYHLFKAFLMHAVSKYESKTLAVGKQSHRFKSQWWLLYTFSLTTLCVQLVYAVVVLCNFSYYFAWNFSMNGVGSVVFNLIFICELGRKAVEKTKFSVGP